MDDKSFVWTTERTRRFFKLKFENEWLFKKRRQPWKEFYMILLQNGFPDEMTINHVRKKWSYTYDCYRIAKRTKNKKWIYYKMFDKHYRKNKALDRFDSWNDEWRMYLIQSITQATNSSNQSIDWRLVEIELRCKELPTDCCIQEIKALWHYLKVTFHRKYRLKLKKGAELTEWPLYDAMLHYYETYLPSYLVSLNGDVDINISRYKDDNTDKLKYDIKVNHNKDEEFHWNRHITESFINLRLQYEWLFQEKKWAWNDFATIMKKEYGFPSYLTGRVISHKWSSTYSCYQKAKATGNTNWLYYSLFETYLGATVLGFDLLQNWNEEWVHSFIRNKTELEPYFFEVERSCSAWREVEKKLRSEGLPVDHSLLDLREMWVQLVKQYKWKKKFHKKGILNEKWPYYDDMSKYMETQAEIFSSRSNLFNATDDTEMNINDHGDEFDYEDDIMLLDLKNKLKDEDIEVNFCRACGEVEGSVNLFDEADDNEFSLAIKMKTIGGVEVDNKDIYPKQICFNCLRELELAFNFRKKCQRMDNKLRSIKYTHSIKVEVDIKRDENDIDDNFANDQNDTFEPHDPGVSDNDDPVLLADNIEITKPNIKKMKKPAVKIVNKSRKKYRYDYTRVCEICGKRSRNIKNHMDSHATEKRYSCEECGKLFKFQSGLAIHKAMHAPEPKKTCEVCGKKFHIMAQYRKHFVYHANDRKFACETCGKAFHTKDILLVHMRMHTDERPFSCPECGKTFRTAGCVSRHRRIVHKKKSKGPLHDNTIVTHDKMTLEQIS